MKGTRRSALALWITLLLVLGGCFAWNETGIWRAERRIRRLVSPGMTTAEAEAGLREAGVVAGWVEGRLVGNTGDVQQLYIGTASLWVTVRLDAAGRVVDVTTGVNTSYL